MSAPRNSPELDEQYERVDAARINLRHADQLVTELERALEETRATRDRMQEALDAEEHQLTVMLAVARQAELDAACTSP